MIKSEKGTVVFEGRLELSADFAVIARAYRNYLIRDGLAKEKAEEKIRGLVEEAFSFELTEDRLRKTLDRHMEHLVREILEPREEKHVHRNRTGRGQKGI